MDGPVKNVPYHTLTSTYQLCSWLALASLIQNSDPYCMAHEQHSQSWLVGTHVLALAPPYVTRVDGMQPKEAFTTAFRC